MLCRAPCWAPYRCTESLRHPGHRASPGASPVHFLGFHISGFFFPPGSAWLHSPQGRHRSCRLAPVLFQDLRPQACSRGLSVAGVGWGCAEVACSPAVSTWGEDL